MIGLLRDENAAQARGANDENVRSIVTIGANGMALDPTKVSVRVEQ
jgi:hypothetical protein